ncbi:MerR family transcriptional regulator [Actinocatenispora comari]|uniref:Transcriptional regulator n=1 Tax=Actinocatenispora comari TaxID=2807577 RepID=A0A8J4ELM5_9ACTN|nr:MerR family transcriptional regulator [Actinocatenispora comari]GIL29422.1 transcriptional regulator [Actinocatenispora comari]
MQIGDAARAVGVSARSLRYYEDQGLIVPGRRSNGYRDYCRSTIDRAAAVRSLLAVGLPVRLIGDVLAGPHPPAGGVPAAEHLAAARAYRDRIGARVRLLRAQQDSLDEYLRRASAPAAAAQPRASASRSGGSPAGR